MPSPSSPSPRGTDHRTLDGPRLRLIALALLFGASSFAAIAGLLPLLGVEGPPTAPDEDPGSTLRTLSLVHAGVFATCFVTATVLRTRFSGAAERNAALWLVRWALLEGAALFGIVIVLLAGTLGAVPAEPLWYLNYASFVAFALSVVVDLAGGAGSSDR